MQLSDEDLMELIRERFATEPHIMDAFLVRFSSLLAQEHLLTGLYAVGVDSWDGYEAAREYAT